jgi:acylphosphatase
MTACKRVQYHGRVQGVGFRYTVQNLAEGYRITGYVRNLPNGDVEVVAEGSAEQVDKFLKAIAYRMTDYISSVSEREMALEGYRGFDIRY